MATVNITARYVNQQKRYAESVVVTVPAMLEAGGGRTNSEPTYIQGGDAITAAVIEPNTLIKKLYVQIDEAFPAGALINVNIAGVDYIVGADGATTGLVVSTEEDNFLKNGQTVTTSITGVSGDVTTGLLRIMIDTLSPNLKNGNYAQGPA